MLLSHNLRLHLRTSLPPSIYRLFSTAAAESPSPTPTSQFAVSYLIQSCGLPSDKATLLSRYLPHLKSPDKPDAVLQFLRQAGVSEPHIRAAALRNPSFLCYSVEKCLKPRINELLQMGFSPSHISLLLSISPNAFTHTKLQQKIQFWIQILGSVDKLLLLLKRNIFLLSRNHENYAACNISFLQKECGLCVRRIAWLIRHAPRLIFSKPEALEFKIKRAEDLGISRSSGMFHRALAVVSCLSQSTVDAKLHYLKSLGFSQDDVSVMISKFPTLLTLTEKVIGQKMGFLLKDVACDKLYIVRFPTLLAHSLEKRLIPRNLVREVLQSKGLAMANHTFNNFVLLNEEHFVKKYVLPYERAIPGLRQAYLDTCAGKTVTIQQFKET